MALNATRLVQFWNLFSPVPRPVDSRYFVEARLENGTSIDLLRGGRKLSSSPVPYPYREFKNQHQRNYLNALEWSLNNPFAHRYLRRLAVDWEQRHPDQKILWTRLLSMRRESRFLDPGRPRKLVEVAWAIPPNSRWQGPLLMPYAETQPLAGVRTDDEGSSKI